MYGNEITYLFLGVAAMDASPIAPAHRREMYRTTVAGEVPA